MPRAYSKEELQKRTAKANLEQFKNNPIGLYQNAANEGLSVTAYLEKFDPSENDDTLDAFERQMAVAGIRTKTIAEKAIYADKVDRFYMSDQPESVVLFPEFINRTVRVAKMSGDITNLLVAARNSIDSDTYRSIQVDMSSAAKFQMKRVGERGELPRATLKTSENAITLYKYGIILDASYEAIRRMRVDQLSLHLQLIALRDGIDRAGTALDVIINGDGNNNAATSVTTASLDSTATTAVTYKAWIAFLMSFFPYQCNTVVANKATMVKILTMQFPSTDPLMLLSTMAAAGSVSTNVKLAQDVFIPVSLAINDTLSNDVIVGLDNRYALEEVTEIGSNLTETDKIISKQFSEIAISEVVGYAKLYNDSTKVLTIGS